MNKLLTHYRLSACDVTITKFWETDLYNKEIKYITLQNPKFKQYPLIVIYFDYILLY